MGKTISAKKKQASPDKKGKECREYKENIVPFLKEELDAASIRALLAHVDRCGACREEMKIQYMVREGLIRLEKGKNFDFNKEFKQRMNRERRYNKKICFFQTLTGWLEAACVVGTVAVLLFNVF